GCLIALPYGFDASAGGPASWLTTYLLPDGLGSLPAPVFVSQWQVSQMDSSVETAVAFAGDHFLGPWATPPDPDIHAPIITESNPLAAPTRFTLAFGPKHSPTAASNGSDFLVAWTEAAGADGGNINGVQVSLSGVPGPQIPISAASGTQSRPVAIDAKDGV